MRLIRWLATVGAVGLISIVLSEAHAIDPVQNLTLSVSAPAQNVLRNAASPVDDIYDGIADRGDLVRENEELRQQVETLEAQLAAQQDAEQRIQELEAALGVKQSRPEEQLLAVNVIAEEPSNLKRMVAIDRGIDDGLDEGMIVLSQSGSLIGTIARAYEDYAWVRLLTDSDSAVNAEVPATAPPAASATTAPEASPAPPAGQTQLTTVRGVAEGTLGSRLLLDLLPPEVTIEPGSLVLTSGLGGNYPPGILIGSVSEVEQRPQSPFKRATLDPAADLGNLETALVLLSFTPARLTPP